MPLLGSPWRIRLLGLVKDYLAALEEDDYYLQRGWEAERPGVERRVCLLEDQMARALAGIAQESLPPCSRPRSQSPG